MENIRIELKLIKKDKGFDILVKHLRNKKVLINRYANIEEIPAFKQSNCETLSLNDKIALIVDYLIKRGNAKPRKVETLSNTINSICGRTLNKKQLEDLIKTLEKKKFISINDTKVTYTLKK